MSLNCFFVLKDMYASYKDLKNKVSLYNSSTGYSISKRSSQTLAFRVKNNTISLKIPSFYYTTFKYYYITYGCEFGQKQKSTAVLRKTKTKKINCLFKLHILCQQKGLVIKTVTDHTCGLKTTLKKTDLSASEKNIVKIGIELDAKSNKISSRVNKSQHENIFTPKISLI